MGNGYERMVAKMTDEELLLHARHYQTYQEELLMAVLNEASGRGLTIENKAAIESLIRQYEDEARHQAEVAELEKGSEDDQQVEKQKARIAANRFLYSIRRQLFGIQPVFLRWLAVFCYQSISENFNAKEQGRCSCSAWYWLLPRALSICR